MCNIIKRLESRDRGLLPPSARFARIHLPRQGGFWCSANSAYSAVPLRGAIVSMGLRGVQGGLRGEIEIFPGPPAKKVINELSSLLFISTPQSIAKPSPGWNKVALLTAVRNSPCSCPFSVSLTRPQDALNSEPRVGSLLVCLTISPVHTPLAYFTWRSHISLRISAISPCASRISLRTKVRFTPSPPPPRRYFL